MTGFTVIGIYDDTGQRFSDYYPAAKTPQEAEALVPEGLIVAGVVAGFVAMADAQPFMVERPVVEGSDLLTQVAEVLADREFCTYEEAVVFLNKHDGWSLVGPMIDRFEDWINEEKEAA